MYCCGFVGGFWMVQIFQDNKFELLLIELNNIFLKYIMGDCI